MFATPILFLIFNRPDTTKMVFEEIRKIKPRYLYIAADGPRPGKVDEDKRCAEVREIVLRSIDWECELKVFFRDENFGCKKAVSEAITWFFENVEEGIILEDDCLPDQSFFLFAEQMLEKFRYDKNIIAINGCNYGFNHNSSSYFFSRYMNAWGWATWRRVAKKVSYKILDWDQQDKISFLRSRLRKQVIDLDIAWFQHWKSIFDITVSGNLDTWDYFWVYHQFLHRRKNIISAKNLIKNIGFSDSATHTTLPTHPASNLTISKLIFPLIDSKSNKINTEYEETVLKPICFMYKRRSNIFYIKNKILRFSSVKFK